MITLTKDYGKFSTYLNIDMWYGDEFEPKKYGADAFFSDIDAVYRGNIYDENNKRIGDYSSNDSVLVGENFLISWGDDDIDASEDITCSTDIMASKMIIEPDPDEQVELETCYIKDFYLERFPEDDLGQELSGATFADILDALNDGVDVYGVMGVGDSVIRERIFEELSDILDVDYDVIYDLWIGR